MPLSSSAPSFFGLQGGGAPGAPASGPAPAPPPAFQTWGKQTPAAPPSPLATGAMTGLGITAGEKNALMKSTFPGYGGGQSGTGEFQKYLSADTARQDQWANRLGQYNQQQAIPGALKANQLTASGLTASAKNDAVRRLYPEYQGGMSGTGQFSTWLDSQAPEKKAQWQQAMQGQQALQSGSYAPNPSQLQVGGENPAGELSSAIDANKQQSEAFKAMEAQIAALKAQQDQAEATRIDQYNDMWNNG